MTEEFKNTQAKVREWVETAMTLGWIYVGSVTMSIPI